MDSQGIAYLFRRLFACSSKPHSSKLIVLISTYLCVGSLSFSADISGRIVREDGKPPEYGAVSIRRFGSSFGTIPVRGYVRLDREGRFSFESLRSGSYQLCPMDLPPDLIRPCEWGEAGQSVQVGDKTAVRLQDTIVNRGFQYQVVIEDAGRKLSILSQVHLAVRDDRGRRSSAFHRQLTRDGLLYTISVPRFGRYAVSIDTPHRLRRQDGAVLSRQPFRGTKQPFGQFEAHGLVGATERITLEVQ